MPPEPGALDEISRTVTAAPRAFPGGCPGGHPLATEALAAVSGRGLALRRTTRKGTS
jgi:hypothetical protein